MENIAVLGAVYGDEGKGRIVHDFSKDYDWVVRFNGGANAGHTIYRDGKKYVHNLMPSFDWRSSKPKAYLASGMVIDLQQLYKEVAGLHDIDPSYSARVYVDTDAFVVLPKHKEEDKQANAHIGSTNRGIGPAYKDKIGRSGTRIIDVLMDVTHPEHSVIITLQKMGVTFTNLFKMRSQFKESSIIFEGAQGILLDINHGIYPYVSCSEATVAGIYSSGFNFVKIDKVYGVAKCYTTKVGEGPFPTEVHGNLAEDLRERGQEYGATTGRPRRIGWLDLPALKYACLKGGITDLIITKFDILSGRKEIPVCTEYQVEPTCPNDFMTAVPKFENAEGWDDASNLVSLIPFIQLVEKVTGFPVSIVTCGVGPTDVFRTKAFTGINGKDGLKSLLEHLKASMI
jgi:adenylosuccinate synthase